MSDRTWDRLLEAHASARRPPLDAPPVHQPIAAVLGCSDARVPPTAVFDQPAGALFVVRIAGNTASPEAVASLDFAVDALGVDLIVVLGHTHCGAVEAAVAGSSAAHLAPIVEPIAELVRAMPQAGVDDIIAANVGHTVAQLVEHDGPTGDAARTGRVEIRGAVHDLVSGGLHLVPGR